MFVVVALISSLSSWAVVCTILSTITAGDWGTAASLGADACSISFKQLLNVKSSNLRNLTFSELKSLTCILVSRKKPNCQIMIFVTILGMSYTKYRLQL